jgi:16S rRNA (adenine1518-N6/adenine1519-N6)-dimethyltransferase
MTETTKIPVRPKKRLGQHFLTAPYYAQRIANAVPAQHGENVVEIGPGTGALSIFLKERFPAFHCVEKDGDVIPRLRQKLGVGDFSIHHADILEFDFSVIGYPLHVAGNLPYSVAAIIIKKILYLGDMISSCTFMVQKEVAQRIASAPGSKVYGFLSIFCQFFGKPKILFDVPPGAFFPKPAVDSSVFQIIPDPALSSRIDQSHWSDFFAFVTRGFSMRRKRVAKALGGGSRSSTIESFLDILHIDKNSRAENLGVEQWIELFKCAYPG